MLVELPDTRLAGMSGVAWVSIAFAALLPMLLLRVERQLVYRRPSLPPPWLMEAEVARSSIPPT
jgi:hypothetical protein